MRFNKIYLEISNICNLQCSFCPGTKRKKRILSISEFTDILHKIKPFSDYLYFHLMGEPLCHPSLQQFLQLASDIGFKVIITTNGTLLKKQQDILFHAPSLHKVNISLHSFEANDTNIDFSTYLSECFSFGKSIEGKSIVVYRLWNNGGDDKRNEEIISGIKAFFPEPWKEERKGIRIGQKIFLEYGDKFDWPDLNAQEGSESVFCYGLRDQIGILCDGTVVPCCLDHEGDLALGNIFDEDLETIMQKPRSMAIYQGFQSRTAVEELCRKCGYARRFG